MKNPLQLVNSLTGKKEVFHPISEGEVGLYVCGPTVYSDVHLGNVRTFTSFDIIYRYLLFLGYKVRYVRNITDVGHLLDDGEDRMSKGARLQKLEPMEVAQMYSNGFHDMMRTFNNLPPSIEPRATGHILEQIEMVQAILDNGLAYVSNGSVYFDTEAFRARYGAGNDLGYDYGMLSGRKVEDLLQETRELKQQGDKRHPADFAIWMKAAEDHIMKWNSPWSVGFPGWHLECSAMSTKYLGRHFDIHGGGNDLKFPHHENEIAQNIGSCGCTPCNYWLHTNMLLMNGKKMSKSDGNTISPEELFSGDSPHVSQGYTPMTVRFFMLQSHYSSPLDLTDAGLQAAEKGYKRLMQGTQRVLDIPAHAQEEGPLDKQLLGLLDQMYMEMSDDFNTPKAMAAAFELTSLINGLCDGHLDCTQVGKKALHRIQTELPAFVGDVLGLKNELLQGDGNVENELMDIIIQLRKEAREKKDWATSDEIRDELAKINILIKDGKEGTSWTKK